MKRSFVVLLFFIVASACSIKSLVSSPYLPQFHDQVQGERVFEMAKSLAYGQFPVRVVADLGYGYGYPLFNFYAPFPYYIGALVYLLSFDLIIATKIMMILGFVTAFASMYYAVKNTWGKYGATLSALLYLTAPYHGVQLVVRGSVGELYAYALLPLVLRGCLDLLNGRISKRMLAIATVALTLILISHNVTVIMLGYFLILFTIAMIVRTLSATQPSRKATAQKALIFLLLPVGLAAFFLLPAFTELKYTTLTSGNDVDYTLHFKQLSQLWQSSWGYGGSAIRPEQDGMSFMIGKITIVLSLVTLTFALIRKAHKKPETIRNSFLIVLSLGTLLSIFLITKASLPLWQSLPYFPYIQFPWRFLVLTNLFVCMLAGGSFYYLEKYIPYRISRYLIPAGIGLVLIVQIFQLTAFPKTKYFETNGAYRLTSKQIMNINHMRYDASKSSHEYMPRGGGRIESLGDISYDGVSCYAQCSINDPQFEPTKYQMQINMSESSAVYIQKTYFPHFKVYVDSTEQPLLKGPLNTLGTVVPKGRHTVTFIMVNTPIRTIANTISLIAILIVFMYYFKDSFKPDENKKE